MSINGNDEVAVQATGVDLTTEAVVATVEEGVLNIEPYNPSVSAKVRDYAYFIGLAVAFLSFTIAGIAQVWFDSATGTAIAATVGMISSGYNIISSGLGVVYRPGASR